MTKAGAIKEFTMSLGGLAGVGVAYELHPVGKVGVCKGAARAAGSGQAFTPRVAALANPAHAVHGGTPTTRTPVVTVPWHCLSDGILAAAAP